MDRQELIEALSDKEHDSWSNWMRYLFSKCKDNLDGSVTIPADLVERWKDLAELPYSHLSEHSKQSDRDEVAHILPIIEAYLQDQKPVEWRPATIRWIDASGKEHSLQFHDKIQFQVKSNELFTKWLHHEIKQFSVEC